MNTKKSDVLLLLRPLAQALSDDDFNEALNLLQVRNLKYLYSRYINYNTTKPKHFNHLLQNRATN
jgi:hypothetical protein